MPGKRGCSGRPRKDKILGTPGDKNSTDNAGTKEPKRGRPRKNAGPTSTDSETPVQEKEVFDQEQYDHDSDTALHTTPKRRAKTTRSSLMDTVIGQSLDRFPTSKLPVKRLVVQRWRSLRCDSTMSNTSMSQKDIANVITDEVIYIWQLAYIPTKRADTVKSMVLHAVDELSGILKYGSRLNPDKEPCLSYIKSLDVIFDISVDRLQETMSTHASADTWKEDFQFYQNQCRVPQVGAMLGIDKRKISVEARRQQRDKEHQARLEQEATQRRAASSTVKSIGKDGDLDISASTSSGHRSDSLITGCHSRRTLIKINSYEESDSDDYQDTDYEPTVRFQREQQKPQDEISLPGLNRKSLLQSTTPAATRFGLSSAAHLAMVASTVNAAGGDMDQIVASLPTAKRHRKSAQQQIAISVRDQFIEQYKGMHKILHWDGKVTQFLDVQGLVYQDCNAVVLSIPMSARTPQFIGAPVVQRGTGVLLADACMHCLEDWEATQDIIGIGFDTTSANTGIHEGAAVHIEEQLGKPVLWLACRHHMAELHVKHPYDKVQGPTKGPDDPLFKRFKEWYTEMVQQARQNGTVFPDPGLFAKWDWDDASPTGPYLSPVTWWERSTLTWVRDQLHANTFPRGDYREFCELVNIILGGEPIRIRGGEVFQHFLMYCPGAFHHARFMGKSLYLLKIFLLQHIFPLTPMEQVKIQRLVGYIVRIYARYFLSAPLSAAAPRHDLTLWYDLQSYVQFDRDIARAALSSIRRHLWYLCPELVILALFDDDTPAQEKQVLALALLNTPRPDNFATGKPGQPNFNLVAAHLGDDKPLLGAFVTERSWLLFHLLESRAEWLGDDVDTWRDNDDYFRCQHLCQDLEVVNDAAERAVKDVTDTANLTRDPAHRDTVIIVRSDHRGRVANMRKDNLNNV